VSLEFPDRTSNEIGYHVKLLAEAGLVEAENVSTFGPSIDWRASSLTWEGARISRHHQERDSLEATTDSSSRKRRCGLAYLRVPRARDDVEQKRARFVAAIARGGELDNGSCAVKEH
jgi:hypothetical protein